MSDQHELPLTDSNREVPPLTDENQPESVDSPDDFQAAMDRLRALAEDLERGDLTLEEAMEHYEEGLRLIEFCEDRLEDAELLIEQVDDSDPENPRLDEVDVPDS